MTHINDTRSLCPVCLAEVDARVFEREGRVFLRKQCATHGGFEAPHPWSDPVHYRALFDLFSRLPTAGSPDGLVIDVTARCNQHCPFCFSRAGEYEMDEPDIARIRAAAEGFPGSVVYLSGGEPALRDDLCEIIREVKRHGRRVVLFSNGKKLADPAFVDALKESGLDLVILQFETFDEEECVALRGEAGVAGKLRAIDVLRSRGIPVYLFAMIAQNINRGQISALLRFAARNRDVVRTVNFNPVWSVGRTGPHVPISTAEILAEIEGAAGIPASAFVENTRFAFYCSSLLDTLAGRRGSRHPWCEMRCYAFPVADGVVPLSRLMDLAAWNARLERMHAVLVDRSCASLLRAAVRFPFWLFLRDVCFSAVLWRFACSAVARWFAVLRGRTPRPGAPAGMLSIIVGTFHEADSIDLRLVATCNLHARMPDGPSLPACLKQITAMRALASGQRPPAAGGGS